MANTRSLLRSFGGGELTPEMYGRIDDAKYQTGLALCRNFITLPHGPAANRAGFGYVNQVKTSAKKTRLIPFSYSTTQTMVLEFGDTYIRFHTQGGTLRTDGTVEGFLSSKSIYEVTTPYLEADLFDLHYVQSADVLTICHPNYAPRELKRGGAVSWTLATISFTSSLAAPTALAVSTVGTGTLTYKYVVTAVGENGIDESLASSSVTATNNLFTTGNFNNLSWATVSGAVRYNVYKYSGGIYGYIGQATAAVFMDDNIAADMGKTPPNNYNPFNASGDYPAAVSYYEQRRCFAGTTNKPQNIWMTRTGTESNMNYSLPTLDDDAISFRVAAREANTIRHVVPLTSLVLLTSAAEWRVTSVNSDAITPSTVSVKPQSYVGASNVQPVVINNNLIYAAARGGHMRELAYSWQAAGFVTGDLSLRAPHLFDTFTVRDMAYAKAPQPIVWTVSSNGKLLGLTYVPEQQVGAWHQHDTAGGTFESCCVVAEGDEDVLYVVVKRTINGSDKRYVERLHTRQFTDPADAFFVDCGVTYSGSSTTTITGLSHLEGKTVNILADGAVHPQRVVASGTITLDNAASKVQVGLPITADIQTLPWFAQIDAGLGQGRTKNVNRVYMRVYRSSGIFAGPDANNLTEAKQRTTENYGAPPALKSDEIQLVITPSWNNSGQVFVRQADPLPLTLVSMTLEVAIGS